MQGENARFFKNTPQKQLASKIWKRKESRARGLLRRRWGERMREFGQKSEPGSQSKKGETRLLPPEVLKGESKISEGAKADISALHRLADRTLEVLLGQVRVTHRHLQCTVTQQLGHQP